MCSVEGFTGKHDFTIEQFTKFNKCRGPDDTTYYQDSLLSLGHNLLSISPNSTPKRQPWMCPGGEILTWNGEIFGLENNQFDTEVFGEIISKHSIAKMKHNINWMGAGVIYDPAKYRLTLFRDHFGIKPLYYVEHQQNIFFSSTARPLYAVLQSKGIQIEKDKNHFRSFQSNDRHMFGMYTPVNRIQRLAPGQVLVWDVREGKFVGEDNLWGQDPKKWNLRMNMNWIPEKLEQKFVKGITEVCNAPGIKKTISLSGGLDSTLIASIAKDLDNIDVQTVKYENFTPEQDETINDNMFFEWDLAKKTAKKFNLPFHTTKYPYDNNKIIKYGQFALSIPQWDRNRWTTRFANIKAAADRGSKIYIVGDGADELLTGYNGDFDYFEERNRPKMNKKMIDEYANNDFKWWHLKRVTPWWLFGDDLINNRLFTRMFQHVDSFCTTVDHMCGNFGMESRMPFLHQELAKFLLKIPAVDKLHVPFSYSENDRHMYKGHYKIMIRDYMKSYIPMHIRKRHSKIGFSTPWNARDDKRNQALAKEDWRLLQLQAEKFFNFDVDFKNEWDDNSESVNGSNVTVDLSGD